MSEKNSGAAITVTVGVIAAALGLGIGNFAAKNPGFKGVADVSAVIEATTMDSTALPIAGSPARGGENAAATVVVFTDLQCKASRELYGQFIDSILKTHGNNVKIVYKAFPLEAHPDAAFAAQAAQAAHAQGKFWPFFDAIYAASLNNDPAFLSPDRLRLYAQSAGLDLARYDSDVNSADTLAAVQKDIELGKRLGVGSTPSVFINTQKLTFKNGVNEEELLTAINREIREIDSILSKPNAKYALANQIAGRQAPAVSAASADGLYPGDALGRSMKGNPNALVTIVEFSDYQCPFCSRAEPTVKQLLEAYPNDVRVIFTHNPLPFHKDAKLAAQAAYAAGLQGKFWEMHGKLFDNQRTLGRENLIRFAGEIGLDVRKFVQDLDDPKTAEIIDRNAEEAQKKGFSGTPAFLINDTAISGAQPIENFKKVIDESLTKARKISQETGLTGEELYKSIVRNYKPAPKRAGREQQLNEGKLLVDTAYAPVLGDDGSAAVPVTIVEFTDFECPFCARGNATVKQLLEKYPGKVRLVFRHNPLPMHKNAMLAHQAAEAARLQGKFWPYYQMLFDNQRALGRDKLIEYAQTLDLDMAKFEQDMDSQAVKDRINADLELGKLYKVSGTPHFFVNGTRKVGARPIEEFEKDITLESKLAEKYAGQGLSSDELYKKIIEDFPKPAAGPDGGRPMRDGAPIRRMPPRSRRAIDGGAVPADTIPQPDKPALPNSPTPAAPAEN